jgi:hypothetical protein
MGHCLSHATILVHAHAYAHALIYVWLLDPLADFGHLLLIDCGCVTSSAITELDAMNMYRLASRSFATPSNLAKEYAQYCLAGGINFIHIQLSSLWNDAKTHVRTLDEQSLVLRPALVWSKSSDTISEPS